MRIPNPLSQHKPKRSLLLTGTVKDMPNGKGVRVRTLIEDYFKSHKYHALSLATKMHYQSAIKVLECITLANNKNLFQLYVHKVDYGTVDYLHAVLAHTHKPATIKFYFAVLSNAWQIALRNGNAVVNPWLRNEVRVSNERDTTWTPEQIKVAIDTALAMEYKVLALYILMAYETGQRPWKDLRDLKWSNIKLHEDGNYVIDFVISKTGVRLILPLSSRLYDILSTMPRLDDFIFSLGHNKRCSVSTMQSQFSKVKVRAMLPAELQFRDIRRTVNTELAEAGATREELRSVNGWKSDRHIPRYARIRYNTAKSGLEKRWNKEAEQNE